MIKFSREWAMPSKNTFDIECIRKFIMRYDDISKLSIDPFANKNRLANITNDIDPAMMCDFSLDALDFIKTFANESVDMVLFDPPYSSRQVSECYKKMGKTVNMETTQGSFWAKLRDEISKVVRPGGYVLSFGWNSNGVGITRGFELVEVMLVSHGGIHNDTICVAEKNITPQLKMEVK